ncbi:MAG: ABC transporter permease [Clostridiales bacterium]|nr:ABC transporter permease [Clostridiales bacterium]MCD8109206.1 ABC transporter permease [Clostridiales bacterium]
MKKWSTERKISVITVVVILFAWWLVTKTGTFPEIIIPSPKSVWSSFVTIIQNGYKGYTLLQHLGTSLKRLGIAYLLVVVTAVPLGLLSGYISKIRAILEPIVEFYRPLPPLAYYTILVLWMGIGESSKLTLLYLAGFAPVYIACVAGVIRIKEDYINGAKTLGAGKGQIFFYVVFPAALTDVFTGLRTALGVEYTTLVAAEMVAAAKGIGWLVLDASNYLRSDIVFMGVILMGITGIVLDQLIRLAERKIVHWKGKN